MLPGATGQANRGPQGCRRKLVMVYYGVLKNRQPFDPARPSTSAPGQDATCIGRSTLPDREVARTAVPDELTDVLLALRAAEPIDVLDLRPVRGDDDSAA